MAGIGCHYMTVWMDRSTSTFSQMGGEGVAWIGQAPFTNDKHVFANLGDGTYFHSGLLAIRAAIAVESEHHLQDALQRRRRDDGRPAGRRRARPCRRSRISSRPKARRRIVIVTDEPEKYSANVGLAPGIDIHHRDKLDEIAAPACARFPARRS